MSEGSGTDGQTGQQLLTAVRSLPEAAAAYGSPPGWKLRKKGQTVGRPPWVLLNPILRVWASRGLSSPAPLIPAVDNIGIHSGPGSKVESKGLAVPLGGPALWTEPGTASH